mmetsp:Transcript_18986/g.31481  ORF Transcript_18986/g.31481 Transcript_18986/m.31481 type:complete len:233 (-) Transcript_18986:184-882(-)|eukprot:CAMPEP_0197730540 /NCGR_PEP_ID=MMETSP1434-20131217/34785_1 /TAXON_ID=265543 /ORGANISM="Minutocellus polymorphus, Strain CCMP3303" /LENGTH=232 /DNA_ID=CAMNT_0043317379 /DNA_START=149 /DNA_END=847 /DNA_ORIENTATION=-
MANVVPKPTLYGMKVSGNVCPVVILLEEAGIDYDFKEVDILKREQQLPNFLAMNPTHSIPVLQHEDVTIYESGTILRYICNRYKLEQWYPSAPGPRALCDMMLDLRQTWFVPNVVDVFVKSKAGFHPPRTEAEIRSALDSFETELWPCLSGVIAKTGGPFLGGTTPNIADLSFYGFWVPISVLNPEWPGFAVPGVVPYLEKLRDSIASYDSSVGPTENFWKPFLERGGGEDI